MNGIGMAGRVGLFSVLLAFVTVLQPACSTSAGNEESVAEVRQAVEDQSAAITAKWTKLGGAGTVGAATSAVTLLPLGLEGEYQLFANGVIVSSDDFGAVFMSRPIFDKWFSLRSQVDAGGANLFVAVGLPTADAVPFRTATGVRFVGGQILAPSTGAVTVVYGAIYLRYLTLSASLGLPTSDEQNDGGTGRVQVFENGEVHWRADIGAFSVRGPILARWNAVGGLLGTYGYPVSDTSNLLDTNGTPIGLTGRFEGGVIYYSSTTGAHELGTDIVNFYESRYGGPNGGLGLPISSEGRVSNGDHFVDFEKGVIVDHTAAIGTPGIYAFGTLDFYVDRFDSYGQDCAAGVCGSQDPYWYLTVTKNLTDTVLDERWGNGDKSDWEVQTAYPIGVARSDVSFLATFRGVDIDSPPPDDDLGTVISGYSISNLWGLFDTSDYKTESPDGGVTGTYKIRNHLPCDPDDVVGCQWWSFQNFSTSELSYEQYSATFDDVSSDESYTHPFNHLWYTILYKSIADSGNCYGMSLEGIYARQGRSPYAQPIFQYFADTACGSDLTNVDGAHASLINQINIKHGYQLGANQVAWTIAAFLTGSTHDPVANFAVGDALEIAGEPSLVTMMGSYISSNVHTVMARHYEEFGDSCSLVAPFCHRIHILDSNYPKAYSTGDCSIAGDGSGGDEFIEIDPTQDAFRYKDYSGGFFTGGRLMVTPFRLLSHQQVTPFANPLELLENGLIMISGSTGALVQATDEAGRTLFEPGLSGIPTRWDDLRHDAAQRIPTLAPVPLALDRPEPIHVYGGNHVVGTSHTYDIGLASGLTAGTPYEITIESARQSSAFTIPGTPGKPDHLMANDIGTSSKSMEVAIPEDSNSKAITWTIGGAEKHRWAEFSSMTLAPAQKLRMHTENAGYRVVVENDGPATSAVVRVNAGRTAVPVSLGTVAIPAGPSQLDFQLPKTTLVLTGQVVGKNGWLVAPVTITLNSIEYTGRGFDAVEYSRDGINWLRYTGPFSYSDQGQTVLYYRARDKDLNQEAAKSQAFKIDTRLPNATGSVSTSSGVKLTYQVTDPVPGSGAFGLHTLVQGKTSPIEGFTSTTKGTLTLPTACSRVEFWAEDVAGNLQSPHAVIPDSVKPVFTAVPVVRTTVCTVAAGLVLGVTATDDCGVVSLTSDAPAHFPLGTTNVTWRAADAAGNVTTVVQQVTAELGDDPSCCPVGSQIIVGTSNNDSLTGTSGTDCIIGLGGQDTLKGLGGDDALSGGAGDDQLWGGDGNDRLYGGTGQDTLRGEAGTDTLFCGDGVDWAYGGIGDDVLYGGQGGDHLYCEDGNDSAYGEADDDQIDGGPGNDYLNGGADHDSYQGGGGIDQCVQDGGDTLAGTCRAVSQ